MTINELYQRFSQAKEWQRLACVMRGRVSDIILKPHGETDADTLTRDRLTEWLTESRRHETDTVPVASVINHMMTWAGKWTKEVVTLKPKKDAKADTELRLHRGRDASRAETDGQPKEEPKSDSSCGRRRPVRHVRPAEPKEHREVSRHARDKAPRASKPNSEGKTGRKRTETKAQPKASSPRVEERKEERKPKPVSKCHTKPETKYATRHPEHLDALEDYADKHNINIYDSENPHGGRRSTGTIYHDNASKGYDATGKRVFKDCWRAEIMIAGQRYRHRSKDRDDCVAWLKAVKQGKIKPTDNKADWWRMEQRKEESVRIDEIIVSQAEEAVMLYDYHQSGDLSKINEYLTMRLLPHMMYYAAHTLHLGKDSTITASRQAAGLLLTRITANRPVLNFTATCKRMMRVYKQRGDFFYYETAPQEVKLMVNKINFDGLAEVWKVTKDRRI